MNNSLNGKLALSMVLYWNRTLPVLWSIMCQHLFFFGPKYGRFYLLVSILKSLTCLSYYSVLGHTCKSCISVLGFGGVAMYRNGSITRLCQCTFHIMYMSVLSRVLPLTPCRQCLCSSRSFPNVVTGTDFWELRRSPCF